MRYFLPLLLIACSPKPHIIDNYDIGYSDAEKSWKNYEKLANNQIVDLNGRLSDCYDQLKSEIECYCGSEADK